LRGSIPMSVNRDFQPNHKIPFLWEERATVCLFKAGQSKDGK
jgi:hypothetical protein